MTGDRRELAGAGLRIYEVGISYWSWTYEEGKKIGWRGCQWLALSPSTYAAILRPRSRHPPRVSHWASEYGRPRNP